MIIIGARGAGLQVANVLAKASYTSRAGRDDTPTGAKG